MSTLHPKYEKPLYPEKWDRIAYEVKEEANWTCQVCHACSRIDPDVVITVHHLDHNTFNNDDDNLQVLCARCHLAIEGKYRSQAMKQRKLNEQQAAGQQIMEGVDPFPVMD